MSVGPTHVSIPDSHARLIAKQPFEMANAFARGLSGRSVRYLRADIADSLADELRRLSDTVSEEDAASIQRVLRDAGYGEGGE